MSGTGGGTGNPPPVDPPVSNTCEAADVCAAAAKRSVTPTQAHIDGVQEPRLGGLGTRTQKFNLGGFGVNPTQNLPNPFNQVGEQLTQPAQERVYVNHEGNEENTFVRVMILQSPDESGAVHRLAFVTLDATGAGNVIQEKVMAAVNAATCEAGACVEHDDVVFGQTHTHAGADLQGLWGGVPQDWIDNLLVTGAADAAREAAGHLVPVELTLAQTDTNEFNNYRRPRVDPFADSDSKLSLLRARRSNGALVASILQYSAHPTSVDEDPRITHADYILGAVELLEEEGGVALYFNGPIADASGSGGDCTDITEPNTYDQVRCRGAAIAGAALDHVSEARTLAPTMAIRHERATLPVTNPAFAAAGPAGIFNRYYNFTPTPLRNIPVLGGILDTAAVDFTQIAPTAETLVTRITIGGTQGLEIVTIPGEATNTFGQWIRSLADPRAAVMLLGLTHNSFGYLIPEDEFAYVDPAINCARADTDPFCNAGFTAPFTGYEEFVSMGPLSVPLLRLQAYQPLFDAPASTLPPSLAACSNLGNGHCILPALVRNIDYLQRSYARTCLETSLPASFCALLDPTTPLHQPCVDAGLPEEICSAFGDHSEPSPTGDLALPALDAMLLGCDLLDSSACLLPFPNDHFTVVASVGSPQSVERGGTGRRVNFNPLATPRNAAGHHIDPTEWNRQDGFSPGQPIVTYVPHLGIVRASDGHPTGAVVGAVPLTDLSRFDAPDASVIVLEVPHSDVEIPQRHLVWAEIDLNAGGLLPNQGVGGLLPKKAALLIRPAKNFNAGRRYVVVLRNLVDDEGRAIQAGPAFATCRDQLGSLLLPAVSQRCAELEASVLPVLDRAGIGRDPSLYLAWDFTVNSAENQVSRLRHMRDDAFQNVLGQTEDAQGNILSLGAAPAFTVDVIEENPEEELARRIRGTFTVPSYVIAPDPSPLDAAPEFSALLRAYDENVPNLLGPVRDQCGSLSPVGEVCDVFSPTDFLELVATLSLPPNRLYYNPTDALSADPQAALYGDGLPDRTGTLSTNFTCNIPHAALSGKDFATATAADARPGRGSLYGHGLLGSRGEVNQDQLRLFGNEHDVIFCAADWFGFASGDLASVVLSLVDLSFFPVVPDGGQQGMLNQMFLARLLRHSQGFRSHPAFQVESVPLIAGDEVYYDGNSQGGILGGVVIAASKDIKRGSLGVIGMNYSTLLTRSSDFALYSVPLYLSYQDDLDRPLVMSLMQMLWDRSENDGYALHLTDNSAFNGPPKQVLLHPAFGDHQVTMWTADVMARTVGAHVDRSRVDPARHPDVVEYFALEPLNYADPAQASGSGIVVWDEPWTSERCLEQATSPPPTGNIPPNDGDDPHECPRREIMGRCQKSNFLAPDGKLIAVPIGDAGSFTCPEVGEP